MAQKVKLAAWQCRMGWHPRPLKFLYFDGRSIHAKCQRCGQVGMIDSRGNLF